MLANLLLPLLLVACGQAQETPDSSPGRSVAVDSPGACNCACARTAEGELTATASTAPSAPELPEPEEKPYPSFCSLHAARCYNRGCRCDNKWGCVLCP